MDNYLDDALRLINNMRNNTAMYNVKVSVADSKSHIDVFSAFRTILFNSGSQIPDEILYITCNSNTTKGAILEDIETVINYFDNIHKW